MSRVRSPNYPQISLPEAIRRVDHIRAKEGRNAASREVLAKLLGFGGLNGASMSVLSAISKYGLIEDAGNKELKVSDLADTILFPHEKSEKASALAEAANKPTLFADIRERWPDRPPSDENLRSYLMRRGFSQNALDNAIACYRETMALVTPESDGYNASRDKGNKMRPPMEGTPSRRREGDTTVRPADSEERDLKTNRIRAGLDDGIYEVNALLVDVEGFDRLIKILRVSRLLFEKHTERFDPETETWSKPSDTDAKS
jgi:hypothetical protein